MRRRLEIWSGGQTGVDRAALDAALDRGLPIGGWVPRGRLAEDGQIPARYRQLREAESPEYARRTRLNVQDTDATLLLRVGPATGGTLETMNAARGFGRPMLEIDLEATDPAGAARILIPWLEVLFATRASLRLNVAGPRASQAPSAYPRAKAVLALVFAQAPLDPGEKTLRSS
ncbi:MAG TPA: putative molybdenum carrier protein [Gemmatimonadales bacterium]|nr:putative molybdenum carrier protein [Gemmatimonadales bacterium]